MAAKYLIAVSGGIGSGKSVVCRALQCMGYPVYDCDSRAKLLMDASQSIRSAISSQIASDAIDSNGRIDRVVLAEVVFADPDKLAILNNVVHGCVLDDLTAWRNSHTDIAFVESAIVYQSGLHRIVDEIWEVTAPEPIRVRRVMQRNSFSEAQVMERIEAQRYQPDPTEFRPTTKEIVNNGITPLIPQIHNLLDKLI